MEEGGEANKSHQVRVQFSDEINKFGHNSNIQVQVVNQFLVNVHLGFLQVRHKYEVKFTFDCADTMEGVFDLDTGVTPFAKIVELKVLKVSKGSKNKPASALHAVTAQLYAHKEKLLKEKVFMQCANAKQQSITFIFYARVLGNGKGTPFLKEGVKCIGFEPDEDDENSDFPTN